MCYALDPEASLESLSYAPLQHKERQPESLQNEGTKACSKEECQKEIKEELQLLSQSFSTLQNICIQSQSVSIQQPQNIDELLSQCVRMVKKQYVKITKSETECISSIQELKQINILQLRCVSILQSKCIRMQPSQDVNLKLSECINSLLQSHNKQLQITTKMLQQPCIPQQLQCIYIPQSQCVELECIKTLHELLQRLYEGYLFHVRVYMYNSVSSSLTVNTPNHICKQCNP